MRKTTKSGLSRRTALASIALAPMAASCVSVPTSSTPVSEPVPAKTPENTTPAAPKIAKPVYHWLTGKAGRNGVVWGASWPQGKIKSGAEFSLKGEGQTAPVQSWTLAYWPDGSLKWTGHAASGLKDDGLELVPQPVAPSVANAVSVTETADAITLATGAYECLIPKSGKALVKSASLNGQVHMQDMILKLSTVNAPSWAKVTKSATDYTSYVDKVTLEQSGPIRAVVKVEGTHISNLNEKRLPFVVRLSLFAGTTELKMVHSFVYDCDHEAEYISGLGVSYHQPLRDELHNRHVRFGSEAGGIWSEAVRNIPGWSGYKFPHSDVFKDQIAGKPVLSLEDMGEEAAALLETVPAFDEFSMSQETAVGYAIHKRTSSEASALTPVHGEKASGLGYLGGASGGVAFGLRHFRESYPSKLDIKGATTDMATVTVWMWPPSAQPMDMRHYSTKAHGLRLQYEDITEGHSTPYGIARTNELSFELFDATPSAETLSEAALQLDHIARLVASPDWYYACKVFGKWAPVDRSTPLKNELEDQQNAILDFYQKEVERRGWLGFWNYGDVMHTYDADRHVWRYDVGGYAWANSELAPDLWLWYAFMRSGRQDIFEMAEAMTRHTGEIDVYHAGPLKGLGSRHNVSHWGGGAKEVRISQALYRRFYYFLTADERTGDLMHDVVHAADDGIENVNPLRKIMPKSDYPTYARSGPDWFALASNWMVEWERTNDPKWKIRIETGLNDIANMPQGMLSGPTFAYDPETGHLVDLGLEFTKSYHLVTIMGGAEFVFELDGLLDNPAWTKTWTRFCAFYNAPAEEKEAEAGRSVKSSIFAYPIWHARLSAFAGEKLDDADLKQRAWDEFLYGNQVEGDVTFPLQLDPIKQPNVIEPVFEEEVMSTNHIAQWSLNMFQLMAMAGDEAPTQLRGAWKRAVENKN